MEIRASPEWSSQETGDPNYKLVLVSGVYAELVW